MNIKHGDILKFEVDLGYYQICLNRVICPDTLISECFVTVGENKIRCIKKATHNKSMLFPVNGKDRCFDIPPFTISINIGFYLNDEDIKNYKEKIFNADVLLLPY